MSVLLLVIGAVAFMGGVAMVGYGIPINEFSFGNTLIVAGTTAAIGGLMVIAIAAAVGQLQRIAETLGARTPARSSRPLEMFDPAAGSRGAPAPDRVAFPTKPTSDAGLREPHPFDPRMPMPMPLPAPDRPADERTAAAAPMLRNPEMPPVTVEDYENVSLSPQHPMAAPAPAAADFDAPARPAPLSVNGSDADRGHETAHETPHETALDSAWRSPSPAPHPQARQSQGQGQPRQGQASHFDAMWPAEAKQAGSPAHREARPEPQHRPPARRSEPEAQMPPGDEARAVAILKSGVVDGMGYTLYVDGSIEAELPQGILRFASINDLRNHLSNSA